MMGVGSSIQNSSKIVLLVGKLVEQSLLYLGLPYSKMLVHELSIHSTARLKKDTDTRWDLYDKPQPNKQAANNLHHIPNTCYIAKQYPTFCFILH